MLNAMVEKTDAGTNPTSPLPGTERPGQSQPAAAPISAVVSVPQHGGLRGGKPRADGLIPGSPEAVEADRKRDAERKRLARAKARAANPPVLPAALPSASDSNAPQTGSADNGTTDKAAESVPSHVAWLDDDVRPLLEELIPLLEQEAIASDVTRAKDGGLAPKVIAEIEKDARWPAATKMGLSKGGAQVLCKWFNRFGVSAKNKGEVLFGIALIHLVMHKRARSARIDRMIEETQTAAKPKEEKKP